MRFGASIVIIANNSIIFSGQTEAQQGVCMNESTRKQIKTFFLECVPQNDAHRKALLCIIGPELHENHLSQREMQRVLNCLSSKAKNLECADKCTYTECWRLKQLLLWTIAARAIMTRDSAVTVDDLSFVASVTGFRIPFLRRVAQEAARVTNETTAKLRGLILRNAFK